MKQSKNIRVALAALLALLLLLGTAACTSKAETETSTSALGSTAAAETTTAEDATAATTEATTAEITTVKAADSFVLRSDDDFEKYFKRNPVAAQAAQDGRSGGSTLDMVEAQVYAADFWKNEIPWAYDRLVKLSTGGKQANFQAQKQQYLASYEQGLEKALGAYEPTGGTVDQISRAGIVLKFYETAAKKVYRELYNYDSAFAYYMNSADAKNAEIVHAFAEAKNFYADWIFGQEYQNRDSVRSIGGEDYSPIRHNRVKTYDDFLAEAKIYFTDGAAKTALKIIGARDVDGKLYTLTLEGVGSPPRAEKLYTYRTGEAEWTLNVTVYDLTQEKGAVAYLSDFDLRCVKQNGAWIFAQAEEFGNVM